MEGRQERVKCLAQQRLGSIRDSIEKLQREPRLPRNGWGRPGIYFPQSPKPCAKWIAQLGSQDPKWSIRPASLRLCTHPRSG